MAIQHWDQIERMNRARDRKAATGGKFYKVGRVMDRRYKAAPPKGSWELLIGTVSADWKAGSGDAINDYQRAVFPERFEEFV